MGVCTVQRKYLLYLGKKKHFKTSTFSYFFFEPLDLFIFASKKERKKLNLVVFAFTSFWVLFMVDHKAI